MRLLLDTHRFLELAGQGSQSLTARIRKIVEDPAVELLLSAVSITEIATKSGLKKLSVSVADVKDAIADLRLTLIPFESRHAIRLFTLPLHHRDLFDRMLIATALSEDVALVSGDAAFKEYRGLRLIR